jgi:hypothetical protein
MRNGKFGMRNSEWGSRNDLNWEVGMRKAEK